MEQRTIIEYLKTYFAQDVLGGKDIGLDETTPLLEWGIINSIETARLLSFINKRFDVSIPPDKLTADAFTNIVSISNLIQEQIPTQS